MGGGSDLSPLYNQSIRTEAYRVELRGRLWGIVLGQIEKHYDSAGGLIIPNTRRLPNNGF